MKPRLSDLWRWDGTIERGGYIFWGVLLAAIKFNLDRFVGSHYFGKGWSLFDIEFLRVYLWQSGAVGGDIPYYVTLLLISLPFIWTGIVLTLRRLRSIGMSPWWMLFFFVPVLKFIFFAILCLIPSREEGQAGRGAERSAKVLRTLIPHSKLGSALAAVFISGGLMLTAAFVGTELLGNYGWSLFVGLPFAMGLLSSLIYCFHERRTLLDCLLTANATVFLVGLGFLLFAVEGVICLLMAAPIASGLATLGGVIGYSVQDPLRGRGDSSRLCCTVILALPLTMGVEHSLPPAAPLLEVKSSVVVNAPPEQVWRNVIAFAELPPPHELIFRLGIAYPIRAEISGSGVGAVRHCNFSTGPFVEPIEVWDEPRLLKFSVTSSPEPMQEWTPYHHIHPRHLGGYLASECGQFRLVPVNGGKSTLLEGTTWYRHHMWPADYWQVWSDYLIHTIHLRVLNHIKQITETNAV